MKLTRLQLDQFRQFRKPVVLDGLEEGINLFVGDNETGKSTLVDAIRAAFFERHKSTAVQHLQPWHDSSATPEVSLTFDWQGRPWQLHKRFLKKQRCDLHIGSVHFSGDEAEEKLAQLLGYQIARRGASKPEQQGIPGLLWVEQGTVQDIREPVDYAGDHLQTALGASLGEVASSSGDKLIAQVEALRGELLTGGGKPRNEYKDAIARCGELKTQVDELQEQIERYRQQVDELGRLRQKQQDIDAARPWLAQRVQAKETQARLDEVRGWQQQQQADQKALANCQHNQELYRQQLRDFAAEAERLQQRAADQHKAGEDLATLQARTAALNQQLADAQSAYDKARAAWDKARNDATRQRLQQQHDQLTTTQAAQKKQLDQARAVQAELEQLREQQQASAIDDKALARLKKLEARCTELTIQQQALASRLEYALECGKSLTVGDETLTGQGERLLLDATQVTIPDVGTLQLKPGGTDVADLGRQQQQQAAKRSGLLQQLGIASLAEGEQRAAANQQLRQQIAEKAARLEGLAPKAVDALASRQRLDAQQLQSLTQQLADYPAADPDGSEGPDGPDEKAAEQALQSKQTALKAAEQAVSAHKSELGIAAQALAGANKEYEQLQAKLQAPDRKARQQQADDTLVDLNAQQGKLEAELANRQQHIDAAQPDMLTQDIERSTKSADAMEQDAATREQQISELRVRLQTLGAQGLEEQYETLAQQLQHTERRRDELQRRADALDLLLRVLRDKRQIVTRQLQAPLQKHLNHYLQLLFPQASLTVDDNLMPETLVRQLSSGPADTTEQGNVDDLSYGAREQMGLISRLAYADLLREAGKPTLIILDDALVHCDADRLAHMKRILYDAAQRHQILLFSCHPDSWRDLGVAARDLQALRSTAA